LPRPAEVREKISKTKRGVARPEWSIELSGRLAADPELRETLTRQLLEGRDAEAQRIADQLARAGVVGTSTAALAIVYTPNGIYSAGVRERQGVAVRRRPPVSHVEVVTSTGKTLERVGIDPLALGHWYERRFGGTAAHGRLARAATVIAKGDFGRPAALTDSETSEALSLREADPRTWTYRRLAEKINDERPADKRRVSHMAVKRTLDKARSGL
jgi:hypothetical protein